ncbi:MAG: response regulator transcription factor [Bacteroidia bacterium]|nr:response regulator transcription factor [Bacteroidia bacterium]
MFLVVEDQPIYRRGIIKVLSSLQFVEVCDEAENGQVALDKFQNKVYDVVFMDIEMEVMNGVTATRFIKEKYPKTIIIILTLHDTKRLIAELFEMGVNGYILKSTDEEELVKALTLIITEGRQYFTDKVYKIWADYLINKSAKPLPLSDQPYFGFRELEIIKLFCQQHTAKSIAVTLQLSESTVNNSRSHIMRKMGVDNIVGLVMYAVKHGMYFPE